MKKITLSLVLASTLMMAAEPNTTKADALVTHAELGYIKTDGNTKVETFNLDANAKKGWGKNIFTFLIDAQNGNDDGVENKNKFVAELSYDYAFTDTFAFNYLVGYKSDKFSGYAYQVYTGPGAKYKAIVSKKHNLSLEANLLYAKDSLEAVYTDSTGAIISYPNSTTGMHLAQAGYDDQYGSYRLKAVYNWQMLENLKFDQELSYRGSVNNKQDNYFVFSKTALTSKLSDMFSAGISYKYDYINSPAPGKENADTTLTANLIIDY